MWWVSAVLFEWKSKAKELYRMEFLLGISIFIRVWGDLKYTITLEHVCVCNGECVEGPFLPYSRLLLKRRPSLASFAFGLLKFTVFIVQYTQPHMKCSLKPATHEILRSLLETKGFNHSISSRPMQNDLSNGIISNFNGFIIILHILCVELLIGILSEWQQLFPFVSKKSSSMFRWRLLSMSRRRVKEG